jgi:hemoglobin
MEHRRFLVADVVRRPVWNGELFGSIGGRPTIDSLIDGLYDRIEADPVLRPMFGRNLSGERAGQKRFFSEWLGGDAAAYSGSAYMSLKDRHDLLPITPDIAERWLGHFKAALECSVADLEAQTTILTSVRRLAMALVNSGDAVAAIRAKSHGTCLRYQPAVEAIGLARRGDAARLGALVAEAPDVLASETHAAALLHLAAINGRVASVKLLLDQGVDVNKPSPIAPLILVTPLCAARLKRRTDVEALLLARGAKEDVFTHAMLGDLVRLTADLGGDVELAQALDPAVDALQITPVHHAVAGVQTDALQLLLSCAAGPTVNGARALREAAARGSAAMVRLLLECGADARQVGAGRWVLHPVLAPMLSAAGARVDGSGRWIGLACTGNQGRKDDPDYVAALLSHGAGVDDRRQVGQKADGGRATALHYAAKAGFVRTISLLLAEGADPSATDDNGLTPLDWLERAAKSVDRQEVRQLLRQPRTVRPA